MAAGALKGLWCSFVLLLQAEGLENFTLPKAHLRATDACKRFGAPCLFLGICHACLIFDDHHLQPRRISRTSCLLPGGALRSRRHSAQKKWWWPGIAWSARTGKAIEDAGPPDLLATRFGSGYNVAVRSHAWGPPQQCIASAAVFARRCAASR